MIFERRVYLSLGAFGEVIGLVYLLLFLLLQSHLVHVETLGLDRRMVSPPLVTDRAQGSWEASGGSGPEAGMVLVGVDYLGLPQGLLLLHFLLFNLKAFYELLLLPVLLRVYCVICWYRQSESMLGVSNAACTLLQLGLFDKHLGLEVVQVFSQALLQQSLLYPVVTS